MHRRRNDTRCGSLHHYTTIAPRTGSIAMGFRSGRRSPSTQARWWIWMAIDPTLRLRAAISAFGKEFDRSDLEAYMRPTEKLGRDAEASWARLAANFEELRARLLPQNLRRRAVQALSESGPVRFAVNAGELPPTTPLPSCSCWAASCGRWRIRTRTTGPGHRSVPSRVWPQWATASSADLRNGRLTGQIRRILQSGNPKFVEPARLSREALRRLARWMVDDSVATGRGRAYDFPYVLVVASRTNEHPLFKPGLRCIDGGQP